ncbi:O-phosphoserine phosphohydrolase [Aphelenchoides bicaudatus]|nr:O-phosphoserine phosphohydrolase [Aphelenchoides bicaudatus]
MGYEIRYKVPLTTTHQNPTNYVAKRKQTTTAQSQSEQFARRIWRSADAVCFDVDSTVCQDEAIDELAKFVGKGDQVARCTQLAMGGAMSFREALQMRLEVMQVTQQQLQAYIQTSEIKLTPGIKELVSVLQNKQKADVYLVSGGFRELIEPVANLIGIPKSNIYANRLLFHPTTGEYLDFDRNEPTSDSGSERVGKARVCALLKETFGYQNLVMVGDGSTDAETKALGTADSFIGFGGNQKRQAVQKMADWFVNDFQELIDELKIN